MTELDNVFKYFEKLGIYTKSKINEIYERNAFVLNENDRDMYTPGGEVSIDTIQQLCDIFHNPKYTVTPGTFANMTYISDVKLNKGYNYKGWSDSKGKLHDRDAIEKSGRDLNKEYLNNFYDSDDYKSERYRSRIKGGVTNPYAIFRVTTQAFNWGAMKYGESITNQSNAILNASEEDLNDYLKNDTDFRKHYNAYCALHPEDKEENDVLLSRGMLDKETIVAIYRTPTRKAGGGWTKINDYFSQQENTGNYGLRLTKTKELVRQTISTQYYMLTENKLYKISESEFWQLNKMFGSSLSAPSADDIHTNLGDILKELKNGTSFNNYVINQIVKLSFKMNNTETKQSSDFTFYNNNIQIPKTDMSVSAEELLNSPETV